MNSIFIRNYQNLMLYFTFFLLWVSIQFGEFVEDSLAYAMVISIGILHGANDLLILSKKEKNGSNFKKNLLIYISIILLCVIIYFISSFIAISSFVLLSAYHFGEEHLSKKIAVNLSFDFFYFLAYGLFIFSLLFYYGVVSGYWFKNFIFANFNYYQHVRDFGYLFLVIS